MSRNFEILQQAEEKHRQSQAAVFTPTETIGAAESSRVADAAWGAVELNDFSNEQVKKLVQRLFLAPSACKAVVFAGVESGNGCSWITAHCTEFLARHTSASVCVVDANLRSPALHQYFQIANHHGLSDAVLSGGPLENYLHQLSLPNLWLLSCGSHAGNRPLVLGSESLRSCIAQLRAQFGYVLIDAPAANACSDVIALGHAADGVALVLQGSSTRREAVKKAVQDLENAKVRVLGAVMNKRTFPVPSFLYKRL